MPEKAWHKWGVLYSIQSQMWKWRGAEQLNKFSHKKPALAVISG